MKSFLSAIVLAALVAPAVAAEAPPPEESQNQECKYTLVLAEPELRTLSVIISGADIPQSALQEFVVARQKLIIQLNKQTAAQCVKAKR
jgi:hypothetical protein